MTVERRYKLLHAQTLVGDLDLTMSPTWTGNHIFNGTVTLGSTLTINGNTAKAFLYSDASKNLVTTAAPTNGQLLIGSTGAVPAVGSITAGSGISVTPGAGTIQIAATGTAGNVTKVGTGTATLAAGAITVGDTFIVWRSAQLAITSNATLTADPVLQLTGLPVGTYAVQANIPFSAGAGGVNSGVTNSGGTATGSLSMTGSSVTSGGALGTGPFMAASGSPYGLVIGTVNFTVSGALVLSWAQSASNAAATTLLKGAYLSVTRLT